MDDEDALGLISFSVSNLLKLKYGFLFLPSSKSLQADASLEPHSTHTLKDVL